MEVMIMKTATYHQANNIVRRCWINADINQVAANRNNAGWILEYVATFFCRNGYESYNRPNTILRMSRRYIEYIYDIKPQLQIIKEREGLTDYDIAKVFGYKNTNAYRCNFPVIAARWLIRGYEWKDQLIQRQKKMIA